MFIPTRLQASSVGADGTSFARWRPLRWGSVGSRSCTKHVARRPSHGRNQTVALWVLRLLRKLAAF